MSAIANNILILSEDQSLVNTLRSDIEMLGYTAFGESLNQFRATSILVIPEKVVFCKDEIRF